MHTKTCHRCERTLPATPEYFARHARSPHGVEAVCKVCKKAARDARGSSYRSREKARLRASYEKRKDEQQRRREERRRGNLEAFAERQRQYRAKLTPERLEAGRARARDWYEQNRPRALNRAKARRDALRAELIAAYGGKCECCGERQPLFLTIDHVNNDGAAHRRFLREENRTTPSELVIRDLKARGWPKDVRLLCYNCNCGRARNGGVCPHQVASSAIVCESVNFSNSSP
jgi:hypothetical protein